MTINLFSLIMLEVLVLGLVGLTYTCVQTLFFLNCLNSRRREQRRLEKAYRDSVRKLKGEVGVDACEGGKESGVGGAHEENRSGVDIENGREHDEGNESPEEDGSQGRLVTRLVVKSGKEVLPTSQERAEALHGVKVHKAVVKLSDLTEENEKGVSGNSDEANGYGGKNGVNFASQQQEETGTPAAGLNVPSGYNITVNSNMIEINGSAGSVNIGKEPIYESLEGDPLSILTEVTVCEDQDALMDCQSQNKRPNESVSVDMLNDFKQQEVEPMMDLQSSPNSIDVHSLGEFQEVQERRMDIDDVCNTEDELESFYHKSLRRSKREDINLVTTISQILCSPPESMEPGSENHSLESFEPRITDLEFQAKNDNHNVSSRSHLATRSTDEQDGEELRVANDASGLPSNDDLSKQQRGESREGVTCYEKNHQEALGPSNAKGSLCPPRARRSTWTLPRAFKRVSDGHGSLPRPKGKPLMAAGRESKGNESRERKVEGLLFSGQTLPRPRGGQFIRRDEAPGGGPCTHLNTCHSTPDMAGAATVPLDTIADSTSNTATTTATVAITNDKSPSSTIAIQSTGHNATTNFASCLDEKTNGNEIIGERKSNNEHCDLKLMDNDPGSTSIHSDEHTDSEESADSLYYTASDHTNSDAYSEIRGDSEENFEALEYEPVETPRNVCETITKSLKKSLNDSNQNETTMSVNHVEPINRGPHLTLTRTSNINELKDHNDSSSKGSHTTEDSESIDSESQYETISDSDHHQDSGYESPVKADIHSSDDAASTASNSSVENHYEDIDPTRMGREERARQSSRRGRSLKESSSRDPPPPARETAEEDEDSDDVRQRQRLQELDDLIAGVPPPDYDVRRPLQNGSATPDVRASGQPGNIPPPPEFGDVSSGSNDSRSEALAGHRYLHSTHSVPPQTATSSSPTSYLQQRSPLLRTASEPTPPPPPPLPTHTPSPKSSPAITHRSSHHLRESSSPKSPSNEVSQRILDSRNNSDGLDEESVIKPSEFIRRNSQRGSNGSFRGHKKVDRPVSLPLDVAEHYGKIMANNKDKLPSTTQDDSGSATLPTKSHLSGGKSLPFIPPKFPSQPSGSGLIKPSEYLRSLGSTTGRSPSGGDVKSLVAMHSTEPLSSSFDTHDHCNHNDSQPASMPAGPLPSIPEATEEESSKNTGGAPPPPPAPPAPPPSSTANTLNRSNTLSSTNTNSKTILPTISVTDLQSVQLRKTEAKGPKPNSVRMPLSPEPALEIAKNDVIAELKMGVDISGIKKLKSERAKEEAKSGKIEKEEIEKHFSPVNFVDQIPEKDNAGNRIPDWKRQMLARKAAERAKKNAEEERQQQLEEKRLQSIPPWKRQLLSRRDDDGKRDRPVTPRTQSPVRIALHIKH